MNIQFEGQINDRATQGILKQIVNSASVSDSFPSVRVYFNLPHKTKLDKNFFNILLLWEPKSVYPWQYRADVLEQFQHVISFSPWRATKYNLKNWVFHPYDFSAINHVHHKSNRDIAISMINAAKFSAGYTSNYGLRRKILKDLEVAGFDVKLYGSDWEMTKLEELRKRFAALRLSISAKERISLSETISQLFCKYSMYQGPVENKFEILSRSELALIVENDSDWITEKIFDAFICGAIPVFVGPQFNEYLPFLEKCIIRIPEGGKNIVQSLKNISPTEIQTKREAIRLVLSDATLFEEFDIDLVWKKVGRMICQEVYHS